jgi:hypothetical protein
MRAGSDSHGRSNVTKRLYLYPFRYRNPVCGKWFRARYVAELHEIVARHAEYEIIGAPEIRDVPDHPKANTFSPWRPKAKRFRYPVIEAP